MTAGCRILQASERQEPCAALRAASFPFVLAVASRMMVESVTPLASGRLITYFVVVGVPHEGVCFPTCPSVGEISLLDSCVHALQMTEISLRLLLWTDSHQKIIQTRH